MVVPNRVEFKNCYFHIKTARVWSFYIVCSGFSSTFCGGAANLMWPQQNTDIVLRVAASANYFN